MDVFLKEPLIDWQKFARRQAKTSKSKETNVHSYALERLQSARSKLERVNPAGTFCSLMIQKENVKDKI